jgi:hypothetical protein
MTIPSELTIILPLAGITVGIAFGAICGFLVEMKIRIAAISGFVAIVGPFTGISFYAYGYSLDIPLLFIFLSCLSFIVVFAVGSYYHKQKNIGVGAGKIELELGSNSS